MSNPLGTFGCFINGCFLLLIVFAIMEFNRDLEKVNTGYFNPEKPLTTQFLLMENNPDTPCPRFFRKVEDKKKVYHALKDNIHPEVQAKWGFLKCHCALIPKMRFSKTARNLNKVFLTVELLLRQILAASIFSGSIHPCIHCYLIPCQNGC